MRLSKYLSAAGSLLRIPTFLLINLYLLVGMLTAMIVQGSMESLIFAVYFFACSAVIALWYINGSALNDMADVEIDKINLKGDTQRPLVVRSASVDTIRRVTIGTAVLALVICAVLSLQHLLICAGLLVLNQFYSNKPARVSRRGGLAPLLLPLGYVFLPFSLGYLSLTDEITTAGLLVLAGLYLHFIGRIILKDYRDIKGDKAFGKKTFLINHGNKAVCIVSAASLLAGAIATIYAVGKWLGPFAYSYVVLLFLGIGLLARLSKTNAWKWQKPILAAFGRSMTGTTACLIFGLLFTIEPVNYNTKALLAFLLVIVYGWSAQRAMEHNIK